MMDEYLRIYQLVENQYIEVEDSIALSRNVKELLNQFLQDCQVSEVRGSKNFRAYIQQEIREKTQGKLGNFGAGND